MQTKDKPVLGIVVPCYNEELVLPETAQRLRAKLQALAEAGEIASNSRIFFVDDGSSDSTWRHWAAYRLPVSHT